MVGAHTGREEALTQELHVPSAQVSRGRTLLQGQRTLVDDEPLETASPTVNPITTMVLLFIIAAYDMEMEVHDVPAAFWRSEISNDAQPLYGFVGPDVTEHIGRMHPPMKIHFTPHDNLFFRLKRYMYGTNEASKHFLTR